MASNTDDTFAQYKTYAGIAIGGVLLAAVLDACTAPTDEEIAEAKAASEATVEARRMAVENPGAAAEENLKPIETLVVAEKAPEPGPARDGAAVYQSACMACHAAGVLEAPKLEMGAWDTRAHKGLDGLTTSAINGINSMPARGGNPAITDEEMKNAVAYMLTESGYDPDALGEAAEEKVAQPAIDPAVLEEIKAAAAEAKAAAETAKTAAADAKASADAAKVTVAGAAAVAGTAVAAAVATTDAEAATAETSATETAQMASAVSVGKQVYDTTCFTCHDVGIFGSPVITDTAAWNERISAGIDALYATAINGNGTNMKPAMGGHPNLSEAQVKAAVDYMLDTAGVDTTAAATGTVTQVAATTEARAKEVTQEAQPEAEATEEKVEEATQEAQPEAEVVVQEAQPAAEATEEKVEEATQEAQPAAEATEEKVEEATQEAQPAAEATEEKTEASAEATQSATQEVVAAAEPAWGSIDGEKVYRGICFSCHDSGVAQAPVLGKATAWEARIAAGMDALYNNSIKGKGIMPAKGGNPALSDDEIRAAVDWMVEQIK